MTNLFAIGDRLPTINSARLRLRWLTDADVPALFAIFGDAEVMRYWSHGPLKDTDDARGYLNEIRECFAKRELFQWGIELVGSEGIVGTCTLAQLDAQHKRAELGFALARAHWGNGYIAEALPALIQFAFDELDLNRLTADADPRNDASIRALERAGSSAKGCCASTISSTTRNRMRCSSDCCAMKHGLPVVLGDGFAFSPLNPYG